MPFEIVAPKTTNPILLKSKMFHDDRGYFFEIYKKSDLSSLGLAEEFVQDNVSFSKKGVLRGLHFQMDPKAQGKYMVCLKGEIHDVVVDVRRGSPTYGKWTKYVLNHENAHILYIPVGFAHGFVVMSDEALVLYKTTKEYSKETESGIIWNDPDLKIDWGINNPILAEKDTTLPTLSQAKNNFVYDLL